MEDVEVAAPTPEMPLAEVFVPPSISEDELVLGNSYTYHSPIPETISSDLSTTECALGIDEAGRGPVLGPMVYSVLYLPLSQHTPLLAATHKFDDSKVLTPQHRSSLLQHLSTPATDLHRACGWACRVMSARDIAANMQRPATSSPYNLNAQAMDATTDLIAEVLARGVAVQEIYVDTIGNPATYQARLQRRFPAVRRIVVAMKADSLYPCVSAASVCAKVTRDAALEVLWRRLGSSGGGGTAAEAAAQALTSSSLTASASAEGWGSGYPSDARCTGWLRGNMDPLFGWGSECRLSWGTAKDLLDARGVKVEWAPAAADDDDDDEEDGGGGFVNGRITDFYRGAGAGGEGEGDGDGEGEGEGGDGRGFGGGMSGMSSELVGWFGRPVAEAAF